MHIARDGFCGSVRTVLISNSRIAPSRSPNGKS